MRGKKKRKQSVFRQLSLMGAILMLVLFLAFVYSSWQMQKSWRENIWNTNQQLMAQIEGKMEEYHQLMTQIATVTAYSPTIYSYFFQDPVERAISIEDVNTVFSNTILLEQNIAGIYLYGREMDLIASMGKGTQEVERMGVIREIKSELEYSSLFSFSDSNVPYYAIYFPIFDLNSQLYGQQIGMCVLIMKPDKFMGILEGAQATEHTQIYLLDRNDRVLAAQGSPDMEKIGKGWKESSSEYQAASLGLPMGGWQIVSRIPTRELYGGEDGLVGFHTGAYLLALCLMFLMVAFCYWRLLVPIREMDCFVKHVASEPRDRISVRREDEIGRVENSLNQMLDSIEEKNMLIQDARERTYQMEAAEKQLQISAYRNQINPHFLYNTLDCIRAMALYHDEDEIAEITLALAKVFRFAVREGNIVMVEEELNYIQEYANIIEHRFRGRIHVLTETDEEARQKPVIKLLLQPLIENAVFHGLEQKIEGGSVKASVRMEGKGYLRFVIEDDGCGIEKEKLSALRTQIGSMREACIQKKCQENHHQGKGDGNPEAERSSRQRGIGMANICQRLRLFYGEKAFFQIESEEGRGTRITMMIPDRVEEEIV
jgi:two-component system sensor histidine kinase YesM